MLCMVIDLPRCFSKTTLRRGLEWRRVDHATRIGDLGREEMLDDSNQFPSGFCKPLHVVEYVIYTHTHTHTHRHTHKRTHARAHT